MRILCFDIGGTAIKYALIENDNLKDVKINKIPTRKEKDKNYILRDVLDVIESYDNLDCIGISTAGVVDSEKGEIIFAGPTIPGYIGTNFKKAIKDRFNLECFVENDVNSAAIGEYFYGSYKGNVFCLTVGTGVGGAFIQNGTLYKGASQKAGEIGYLPLNGGKYQEFASTTYLTDTVSEKLGKKVDGLYIFENAKKGDKLCKEAIDELIDNLSEGILNIIYILNPNTLIIGGGITAQKEYLENRIKQSIKNKLIDSSFEPDICLAKLENGAGIYGIYYIVKGKEEQ